MVDNGNFMIPTENKPYTAVEGMPGVGIKYMSRDVVPGIWSAVIRVAAGQSLPSHKNVGLCEMLVIAGQGSYSNNERFAEGDYLRETSGSYNQIEADNDLVIFVTHHGHWTFPAPEGTGQLVMPGPTD